MLKLAWEVIVLSSLEEYGGDGLDITVNKEHVRFPEWR